MFSSTQSPASTPPRTPTFRINTLRHRPPIPRSATFQFPSPPTPAGSPSDSTPRFSRLLGSVLGSPFLTTTDVLDVPTHLDLDVVDGAMSVVPHTYTVTRPASPAPTMDFSIISPPSPTFSAATMNPNCSFFTTPPRRMHASHSLGAYPYSTERISPLKNILPRIWDAFSSPGKKVKGKTRSLDYNDCNLEDLPPLDGEEGELIDDEACFIDVRAVTGIDIISHLPPEVGLHLLLFLDLPSVLACLGVSRSWRALAEDSAVWRELFHQREGWGVDVKRAKARGWVPGPPGRDSIHSVSSNGRSAEGASSRLSHAIEEWGRRRLSSSASTSVAGTQRMSVSVLPKMSLRSINGVRSSMAPLMLDWRVLYKTRLELEKRWISGQPKLKRISGHADSVYCLEFDSARIITGSRDRTIKVWSLATGKLLATFFGHGGSVLCLKFDKDWDVEDKTKVGFMVSGSSDCSVCVWDMRVGNVDRGEMEVKAEVRAVLKGHSGGVLDLRIDERWIVSCSKDAVIRVWDRATLALYCTLRGHEGPVNAVGLQSGRVTSASGDGRVILWDIETGEPLRIFEGHNRGLACIEFKDDLIVSGSNDWKIKVWSASTGECLQTLVGHDALVRALSFDPASGRLVSASYDKSVKVWDLKTGRLVREFRNSHVSHIFDVKFDACRIVSTSHDQKIVILDFSQGLDTALFV